MVDFLMISTRSSKRGDVIEIYPKFIIRKSSDLMIRGGDFYAIWLEEFGRWSTEEQDAIHLIDRELDAFAKDFKSNTAASVRVLHMWDSETGMIDKWHKYCQSQMRDNYHTLDTKIIFSNMHVTKEDYTSKKLTYPLEKGAHPAYDRLMSVLYSPEERRKLEWAIGAIVAGDSKKIQKFLVLYGEPRSGKSTVLNIIGKLFEGYCSPFDAKVLGQANAAFALEAFKNNPLVAIQHDGDLSRIEDNTRLNSLVSHETMMINEKFKSAYANHFISFLFMGTNKPVKITDAKSGLIRRLIDVSPTGKRVTKKEYDELLGRIDFELGHIADYCLEVYKEDPGYYDNYIPTSMLGASNDFFNFMEDSFFHFKKTDGISQKAAWDMYKQYCEDANVPYPYPLRIFKEELRNYFEDFFERYTLEDGTRVRNYYKGLKLDKFQGSTGSSDIPKKSWLEFDNDRSIFDEACAEYPAQYASGEGTPLKKWENVKTVLGDLDSRKLHYVFFPEGKKDEIVIDFDIPDENGNKSFERNFEEASKWPPTYAELSKSGQGIHLHYIYDGDVTKLKSIYSPHVEVKVFTGNSSLRRMLTKCNSIPIATISSGLPLKGEKMISTARVETEKGLRKQIKRNLNREIHPNTKPSIDFIKKILDDAYESGIEYDVTDMLPALVSFASESSHQADYCLKTVGEMQLKSEHADEEDTVPAPDDGLIFFDCEVAINLFLICWKRQGKGQPVVRMYNPSVDEVQELCRHRLVGFNNRRYDNHILYGRLLGYSNAELFDLSKRIVGGDREAFFGDAYNLSYTDIYDFSSEKKSLKKFEIELGIHHKELGLPWDEPWPEDRWEEVGDYCENDVIATEAVFDARHSDFVAREILADIAGMTVNDTTNSLTTRIIFGKDRTPQHEFNYRNMGSFDEQADNFYISEDLRVKSYVGDDYTKFDSKGRPVFPGYKFSFGKSTYRDVCADNEDKDQQTVGEGGYVYAQPGMYTNVALLDIASMHPSSVIAEQLFGRYTKNFEDLVQARIAIKHKDFDRARKMLDGKLAKYLTDEKSAKTLSKALKIPINSVYGLTAANFDNPFRDKRNVDNIVAKRGALFMINLRHAVTEKGFKVAHIKTDSIKIPGATPEIIKFVMDYGSLYGYNFEHEATYERMCLVNNAVYIARYATKESCMEQYGYSPEENAEHGGQWTATGAQFAVPCVFKTLFSHEPMIFSDFCETKQVTTAIYLDMCEKLPDVSGYEKELAKYRKDVLKATDGSSKFESDIDDKNIARLKAEIAKGHNYIFVGRVGLFCPMKPGANGGRLVREVIGKNGEKTYSAVTGTKDYWWQEAEMVETLGKQELIDTRYYERLVEEARAAIAKFGDAEWFINGADDIPPWEAAEQPWNDEGNAFAVR